MHNNRLGLARKFLLSFTGAIALFFLTGCEFKLTNLTPDTLQENPSQIYTLTLRVMQRATSVVPGSIAPQIIIDGQNHPMRQSALAPEIFEYEYPMPPGRDQVAYYFLITYKLDSSGRQFDREAYTDVQHTKITRRNVLALTANRGPVGSRIGVLGHGFTAQDVVYLDATPAMTMFESTNSVGFVVPPVSPDHNYRVSLNGPAGSNPIGTFRVDSSSVQVSPSSLNLRTGQRQMLTFSVPSPAPTGGILLDVTTDIHESIIMPEVVVPAGQASVSIPVEGGAPGRGNLYLRGLGSGEIMIPVTVSPR